MVERLKPLMTNLIGPAQASFIPGRVSTDNIVFVQEAVHSMRRKKGVKGWMLLKLDLEKAYDRIRWDYLEDTLISAGFPEVWLPEIARSTFGARRVAPEVGRADASKRPRVSDHRWGFRYDDMAAPFTSNSVACAELLREIGRGSGIPSMPLDLKEEKVFAGAARKSIEAIAEWDRLTYLYERCVRSLSVEATNAKDAHEALAVEKEKVAQALADLARSQDDAKEMKRKYDELAGRALSEMKRLRERRLEYAEFVRRSALDKMAELVQKRLDRIKAHIDDTKAAEPKFLEFNQMLRLVADAEELEAEVKAFGITDLMDGDFDVRTLFAELSPDNRNSVPPPTEGEDLADGRGECEGQAGERIVGQTEVRDEIADARD
ncbi:putative protein [Arabidopsis thaliana]|uniref:RNA binding / RNA-directed DNA polymerase n=1 Tax=Arabidopsis thaliana TaxID=3702 RepID=Q9SUM7_ARATH|nr:RNA binding / RNA-directed DNA polymerase [Arabidopsis thaliana]AEE84338.1 RNA binding / RNA-directed DNA polymerase [Arabidopsis thaliana]CAB45818.1 putative protein [Arabidopsis thaliana]CAB79052.1 putative protein [Arabidopsis thaliana]|eukprot:NP_193785.1 RNA binding / RNA-directed DNA polymerase [Arabidopsis thaliana]